MQTAVCGPSVAHSKLTCMSKLVPASANQHTGLLVFNSEDNLLKNRSPLFADIG